MSAVRKLTKTEVLDYEIRGSSVFRWMTQYSCFNNLVVWLVTRRVRRKYANYVASRDDYERAYLDLYEREMNP